MSLKKLPAVENTAKRELLVINGNDSPVLPDEELAAAGWSIMRADTVHAAIRVAAANKPLVGIIVFKELNEEVLEPYEELILANRFMEWLALLPADSLDSSATCHFMMHNFHDYHTLPIDPTRLLMTLGHAYGKARLKSRIERANAIGNYRMVGASQPMDELFRNLRKMHGVDSPVLITGESGTGKDLAAQAIHLHSARRHAPFVAVNCGALPSHLIQSELFGHEKGSFTGAFQRKIGQVEAAAGGTVFLDEIGDLPLELQVTLLRFLQNRTVQRIGSTKAIPVDVRIIAATNVDIEAAVQQGRFREDLYYRLNVLRLKIPPLRERGGDVELLAKSVLEEFSHERNHEVKGFSRQALRAMSNYNWPGNVRELINRVRQALIMTENRLIAPADLGLDDPAALRLTIPLDKIREKAEAEAIHLSLQRNQNNVSKTAQQLGVSRVTLYRLMNKFQIYVQ